MRRKTVGSDVLWLMLAAPHTASACKHRLSTQRLPTTTLARPPPQPAQLIQAETQATREPCTGTPTADSSHQPHYHESQHPANRHTPSRPITTVKPHHPGRSKTTASTPRPLPAQRALTECRLAALAVSTEPRGVSRPGSTQWPGLHRKSPPACPVTPAHPVGRLAVHIEIPRIGRAARE